MHDCCIFYFAAVLSFDEAVSKTISREQYKWMAINDAAETRNKDSSDEKCKPVQERQSSCVASVSGPSLSMSSPRQSKSGMTPRSARSSAAYSTRGTYVKSKTGFSKYGRHPPSSASSSVSKHFNSPSSSCVSNQLVKAELSAPKMASNNDALAVDLFKHVTVDDVAASLSQLFAGSFPYHSVL